jgi:cardiolipin synthase A/B
MIAPTATPVERFLDRAFARATGAAPVPGNRVRLLRDGDENYAAWLQSIADAREWIHFESYIIHDDEVGLRFAEAMAARARAGVRVRVLYDWLGSFQITPRKYARILLDAGAELRAVNPPHLGSPLAWLSRDHRKSIAIDGQIGYVSGLCVGQCWVGENAWRDTGIEVEGPAVAMIEDAFADLWAQTGEPLPAGERINVEDIQAAGRLAVRVVASTPGATGMYRLDQLVAAAARKTLWLTDAYFIATTPYVQALKAAASDGVDVRLLVPGSSDVPGVRAFTRAGYRALLEGGIRVFEWNGSMLHAKTAVADTRWARVGSTNLNPSSWLGNWELDVSIEDETFARQMEAMYEQDLMNATEIVIGRHRRMRPIDAPHASRGAGPERRRRRRAGGRMTAGAIGIGSAVGAALTRSRPLGAAEARILGGAAVLLVALGVVGFLWPRVLSVPLAFLLVWTGLSVFARAWQLHRNAKRTTVTAPQRDGSAG